MGKKENIEFDGSVVFAYLLNSKRQYYMSSSKNEQPDSDPIVAHPEIYGLNTESSRFLPTVCPVSDRPDSGYLSSSFTTISSRLLKDLCYIDHVYYPSRLSLGQTSSSSLAQELDGLDFSVFISLSDIIFASRDKSLCEVYLSSRAIRYLTPNISMLTMIRHLDLYNNHLTELPESIGCLHHLEVLTLSRNFLTSLPDTICYLSNLTELNLSCNELETITPYIRYLENLKTLSVAVNRIRRLPKEMGDLISLMSLDVSRNPLKVIPVEVAELPFLRRLRCNDCPLHESSSYPLRHDPPSLVEFCARDLQRLKPPLHLALPDHLKEYLRSVQSCSSCYGPYFESCVIRTRLVKKSNMFIPIEYRMCSGHWSDADDRILDMFSLQSEFSAGSEFSPQLVPPTLYKVQVIDKVSRLSRSLSDGKSTLSRFVSKLKRPIIPW